MIFDGGIWTVGIIVGLAFGYARVFDARRWVCGFIILLAVIVIVASQFLPKPHPFYQSVRGDLIFFYWATLAAIPIGLYAFLVRLAHKKAGERDDA